MDRETQNIWIGAAVFVIVPVFLAVFFTGDVRTKQVQGFELTAHYNRVDGVSVGAKVLLAGIPVGQVRRLEFDAEGQQAILTFLIQDGIKLPNDTVAMIVSDGLMGGKFIKLEPGGEIDLLQPGDVFTYVQDAVLVESVLEKIVLRAESKRRKDRAKKDRAKTETGKSN
ncbi:MAG: MCE family protein [Rhodospirillaceae bacterium]|jgi:phospholipid/cholesterol/gamma-HCH transport system substrate-binding protein|nr:MCE family protein [Rhodospirillaceae bacterium]MBT5667643.1 MCE family protein [Rhodospirillaceae bacterium]